MTQSKPIRLWPGVVAVVVQGLAWFVVPVVVPDARLYGMFTGIAMGLVVAVWWLLFSRAPWVERIGAFAVIVPAMYATRWVVDPSIANAGQGMLIFFFGIPVQCLAVVLWGVATRSLPTGARRASMVAAILLACGVFTLVRTGGITGDARSDLHWRWTPTPEQRLLAQAVNAPEPRPAAPPVPAALPAPAAPVETARPESPAP